MKKIIKPFLSAALALSITPPALADISCTATPDCASLGYTQTAAECNGKASVICPFDTNKYYCKKTPVIEGCAVGSYLYTDKSCSATIDRNRTLVGIVVDPVKKLAIHSMDGKTSSSDIYFNSWHKNMANSSYLEYCSPADALLNCGTDGKENTRKLKIYPEVSSDGEIFSDNDPARYLNDLLQFPSLTSEYTYSLPFRHNKDIALYHYIPSSVWYGYGHWYLPSLKELNTIRENINNKNILSNLKYTKLKSSTKNDHKSFLALDMFTGEIITTNSTMSSIEILPVINYGDTTALTDVDLQLYGTPANVETCIAPKDGKLVNACNNYIYNKDYRCDRYGYKVCDKCNGEFIRCCTAQDRDCIIPPVSCDNPINNKYVATSIEQMQRICGLRGYFICNKTTYNYEYTCCEDKQTGCTQ